MKFVIPKQLPSRKAVFPQDVRKRIDHRDADPEAPLLQGAIEGLRKLGDRLGPESLEVDVFRLLKSDHPGKVALSLQFQEYLPIAPLKEFESLMRRVLLGELYQAEDVVVSQKQDLPARLTLEQASDPGSGGMIIEKMIDLQRPHPVNIHRFPGPLHHESAAPEDGNVAVAYDDHAFPNSPFK